MAEEEYTYNGQIWLPQPTVSDGDSFFHATFGEGCPSLDKDASFRRKCLSNFLRYHRSVAKPKGLTQLLETSLGIKESDQGYTEHYQNLIDRLCSAKREVCLKDIPIVASLENTVVVVFTKYKESPDIFAPEENFHGSYPWKTQSELTQAVICLHDNVYTSLRFDRSEQPIIEHSFDESIQKDDEPEDQALPVRNKTYSKLTGAGGIKGCLYQINLLTIYLLKGQSSAPFWLSTENKTAGKFDDVVFETTPEKGQIKYKGYLLQAKHKQNKKITYDSLYQTSSNQDDFSLPKYYLSYQLIKDTFNVQRMTLCSDTDLRIPKGCNPLEITKKHLELTDFLYFEGMQHYCYTFNETIVSKLIEKAKEYKEINLQSETFNDDIFDEDQVKEFLGKFQLVTGYPTVGDLDEVVEEALLSGGYCNKYETKDCAKFINNKVLEWFEGKQARYLNQDTLKIFLSEFHSAKFCVKLRNFQMYVEDSSFGYSRAKRLLRIESGRGYILNMMKLYFALYASKRRCLFLSPEGDDKAQIDMVDAFAASGYDTLVACFKTTDAHSVQEISDKLTGMLRTFSYKRVIFITGRSSKLAELLKSQNEDEYQEVFENITFNDLSRESQSRLLKRVAQFFHTSI